MPPQIRASTCCAAKRPARAPWPLPFVLITCAVMLLDLPFLKVAGGALLVWIGAKLLLPEDGDHEKVEGSSKLIGAIKTIIVADFVMSFDNVIAIAGAAQQAHETHQTLLIIFGLLVSVPFIVFSFVTAVLLLYTHRKNIVRLKNGTESKIYIWKPHRKADK